MDGVRYQIEQLQHVLGQLDPHRMLAPEEVSQLQLSLAKSTAIARRVVERQHHRTFPMRLVAADADAGGRPGRPIVASPTFSSSGEVRQKEGSATTEAVTLNGERTRGEEYRHESIRSIATQHGISVDEIRRYNPQLSFYNDEDVLPYNTYIKMKPQLNQRSYYGNGTDKTSAGHCVKETQHHADDTVSAALPIPLAPLPALQEAHRHSMNTKSTVTRREESPPPCEPFMDCADSMKGLLMQLPSLSPEGSFLERKENYINHTTASDLHDRSHKKDVNSAICIDTPANNLSSAGCSTAFSVTEPPKGMLSVKNSAEMNTMASEAVSNSHSCVSRIGKPPFTHGKTIVPSSSNDAPLKYRNRPGVDDFDFSITTESSSFHSTPTPTPNLSPQLDRKKIQMTYEDARGGALENNALCQRSAPWQTHGRQTLNSTPEDLVENGFLDSNELSPIPKASYQPVENWGDFDTINSIALQYNVSIKDVLKWNPYLLAYGADDPLPANFPILLPIPQQE
ncbi:hypothetical protein MOQ_008880 [Trypanosoma cruzi marinkellei]|uniref:LysM domain-containing protein n=1 Tax=Trypanosoma cruzi marinkellei TaxID=85056 RepID=K2MP19_TRYCR|nr:hypothetical protein MOQ_008880 [Trypanosoma cruzi marinkellei]